MKRFQMPLEFRRLGGKALLKKLPGKLVKLKVQSVCGPNPIENIRCQAGLRDSIRRDVARTITAQFPSKGVCEEEHGFGELFGKSERLARLNAIAIQQMKLLTIDERTPQLPEEKKRK